MKLVTVTGFSSIIVTLIACLFLLAREQAIASSILAVALCGAILTGVFAINHVLRHGGDEERQ